MRGSQGQCSGRTEGGDSCTRGADHGAAEAPHGAYRSATEAQLRAQWLSDGAATAELCEGQLRKRRLRTRAQCERAKAARAAAATARQRRRNERGGGAAATRKAVSAPRERVERKDGSGQCSA